MTHHFSYRGWFAVAFTKDVLPGKILSVKLMGKDLIVYRSKGGTLFVKDAHCPHVGAHLGDGCIVDGEHLECPFHKFRFDRNGHCTSTPYGKKVPKISVRCWPSRIVEDTVLVWVDPTSPDRPSWEPLAPTPAPFGMRWSAPQQSVFTTKATNEDIIENAVDTGHFQGIHGVKSTRVLGTPELDGPYLRFTIVVGNEDEKETKGVRLVNAKTEVHVDQEWSGLGLGNLILHLPGDLKLRYRLSVSMTDAETMIIRNTVNVAVKDDWRYPARSLKVLPLAQVALARIRVEQVADSKIWAKRKYLQVPGLAEGDGPIGLGRKWSKQFLVPRLRTL